MIYPKVLRRVCDHRAVGAVSTSGGVAQALACLRQPRGSSLTTCRRKTPWGIVWMLSKLTTQSVGTPSSVAVSWSSATTPRTVRVMAATTTDPMRSATGSLVSTSTGRSPPGVAANQISPRCIGPVRPVFGRSPVSDLAERRLVVGAWLVQPGLGILFGCQADEMAVKRLAQQFEFATPAELLANDHAAGDARTAVAIRRGI